jgi:protein-S-isoprenylcysteine O-methyltransferase
MNNGFAVILGGTMAHIFLILCLLTWAAFFLEEFVLIWPVSTIAQSDPLSQRLEKTAFWLPPIGMGITVLTINLFGGVRLAGILNGLGLLLCLLGLGLRYWSRRILGRFFTIGVVKQEGHRVIQHGPYRLVRHPAYLAFMLYYLGFPRITGSWLGLLVLSLPACIIFLWLTVVEDRHLARVFGSEYQAYQKHSAKLIPHVW